MKIKLIILLMALGLGANAQYVNVGANGVQRQIVAGDSTFRWNLGTAGFLYGKSLSWYRSAFAPITGGSGYIQNQNAGAQTANAWLSGGVRVGDLTTYSRHFQEGYYANSAIGGGFLGATSISVGDQDDIQKFTALKDRVSFKGLSNLSISILAPSTISNTRILTLPDSSGTIAHFSTSGKLYIPTVPTDATPTQLLSLDAGTGEVKKVAYSSLATAVDVAGKVSKSGDTMTGDLLLYSATPTNALSAVPKSMLDNAITGITWKNSARVATIVNLALTGLGTIDGITLVAGNRVLVKNQTLPAENGIYIAAVGAWIRAVDADSADEINTATIAVMLGTVNKNTQWTATSTITTIGIDPVTFGQISGAGTYAAGTNMTLAGNVFSTSLNPVFTTVSATTFTGALVGNASTATALANSRTLWGQSFNGTANINNASLTGVTTITATGLNTITSTTEQLRLAYNSTLFKSFTTDINGTLNITGTSNASAGLGYGVTFNPTIAAKANNDVLSAINIPAFTVDNSLGTSMLAASITTAGSGYVNGSYSAVPLTGGSGTGATANVVISGGGLTSLTLVSGGSGYVTSNTLSIANSSLGGTGSGIVITATSVGFTNVTSYSIRHAGSILPTNNNTNLGNGTTSRYELIWGSTLKSDFISALTTGSTGGISFQDSGRSTKSKMFNNGNWLLSTTLTADQSVKLYVDGSTTVSGSLIGNTNVRGLNLSPTLTANGNSTVMTGLDVQPTFTPFTSAINTASITNGGSGYTNNTYSALTLTGGSGSGATADITVSGGAVTAVSLMTRGTGYVNGDVLTATIPGGTGFTYTVSLVGLTSITRLASRFTSTETLMRLAYNTANYIDVKVPSSITPWIFTLPANAGSANTFLQTDGSGNTSWVATSTTKTLTGSGTGAATTIVIPHGLSGITTSSAVVATANNAAAAGFTYVTIDATNINVFYTVAPASGTNNLLFSVTIK